MRRIAILLIPMAALSACGSSTRVSDLQESAAQNSNVEGSHVQNSNVQESNSQNAPTQNANTQDANTTTAPSALACPGDANDAYASVRIACVQAINRYRATLGLAAYARWCGTASCIDQQTHQDSQQQSAHSAFGDCSEHAQNECPGWSTPVQAQLIACLGQMWAEGPGSDFSQHGHYINMTSQTYTRIECGVSVSGNTFWGAMDFR